MISRQSADTPLKPSRPHLLENSSSISSNVLPSFFIRWLVINGSKSPIRLLFINPVWALAPMLLPRLWPSAIAQIEHDPPRWHEMIRKSLPKISRQRVAMYR